MLARIFALIFTSFFLLLASPVSAQAPTQSPSTYPLPAAISPTSPLYTDLFINNLFHSFSCLAMGQSTIGQPCVTYQINKTAEGIVKSVPVLSSANLSGGALGGISSVIDALYLNPPVRTDRYLASFSKGSIVKEAHAQVTGSGAGVLDPILRLWQLSRNISYVFMTVIFLVIGLMIIFRNKINPQTVITAQAALPGLIIGLIMITFSYFLASLLTDVAFLGTNLVGYYFSVAQGNDPQDLVTAVSDESILAIFSRFIGIMDPLDTTRTDTVGAIQHGVEVIFNNVSPGVQNFIRYAVGLMAFQYGNQIGHIVPIVGTLAGIATGLISTGVAAAFPAQIMSLVLSWVVQVILIYSMLKLLIRLINNYLSIIFLTVSAPFQFLFASLPGRQGIMTGWVLSMLCNILAFPAVLAILYFVAYMLNISPRPFDISSQIGLISPTTLPLFGGLDTRFINTILAFGALIALPSIPDVICRSLGRASQAGQLIGQEISGNIRGGRGYSNQYQQLAGGISKIGQEITEFRGRPPGWSPALEAEEEGVRRFGFFGRRAKVTIPGLGARRTPSVPDPKGD